MPSATDAGATSESPRGAAGLRRMPTQTRSRERVTRIVEAAAELVVEPGVGVDGLTTRAIADRAGLPVASLYQYFADKEAVLLALCERDMTEMDEQVATDLALLDPQDLDIPRLVATSMRAFVTVYDRRPAFMQVWMRGRTNAAIYAYGRQHNQRITRDLLAVCLEIGLIDTDRYDDDQLAAIAELAVEVGDRAFQLAFEHDAAGDPFLIAEAISLVTTYLERVAR